MRWGPFGAPIFRVLARSAHAAARADDERDMARPAPGERSRSDEGFTLIEVVVAIVVFAILATAFAAVMSATMRSFTSSKVRTLAEQAASSQLEDARRLAYEDIGTVSGNPPGLIQPTRSVTNGGLTLNIVTRVSYVNDPVPNSTETGADYKSVKVTVTSTSVPTLNVQMQTLVAPPDQPSLSKALVKVLVVDYAANQPVPGVTVTRERRAQPEPVRHHRCRRLRELRRPRPEPGIGPPGQVQPHGHRSGLRRAPLRRARRSTAASRSLSAGQNFEHDAAGLQAGDAQRAPREPGRYPVHRRGQRRPVVVGRQRQRRRDRRERHRHPAQRQPAHPRPVHGGRLRSRLLRRQQGGGGARRLPDQPELGRHHRHAADRHHRHPPGHRQGHDEQERGRRDGPGHGRSGGRGAHGHDQLERCRQLHRAVRHDPRLHDLDDPAARATAPRRPRRPGRAARARCRSRSRWRSCDTATPRQRRLHPRGGAGGDQPPRHRHAHRLRHAQRAASATPPTCSRGSRSSPTCASPPTRSSATSARPTPATRPGP